MLKMCKEIWRENIKKARWQIQAIQTAPHTDRGDRGKWSSCDSIAYTVTTAGYLHMLKWNLFAITVWCIACVCVGMAVWRFDIEQKNTAKENGDTRRYLHNNRRIICACVTQWAELAQIEMKSYDPYLNSLYSMATIRQTKKKTKEIIEKMQQKCCHASNFSTQSQMYACVNCEVYTHHCVQNTSDFKTHSDFLVRTFSNRIELEIQFVSVSAK